MIIQSMVINGQAYIHAEGICGDCDLLKDTKECLPEFCGSGIFKRTEVKTCCKDAFNRGVESAVQEIKSMAIGGTK